MPFDPTGFIRDVSRYPDVSDLLLAADLVVSDYSSLLVQQAALGRPTVLFAPDLERFRHQIRGLYLDDSVPLPGPVVTTTDELIATVVDPDSLLTAYRAPVAGFAGVHCPLADGKASARVVDRLLG